MHGHQHREKKIHESRDSVQAFFWGGVCWAGNGSDHRDVSRLPSKWKSQLELDCATLERLGEVLLQALKEREMRPWGKIKDQR